MNDPKLHLFVDNHEIHQYVNLMRFINKPQYLKDSLIYSDTPWEYGCMPVAWGSVIKEKDGLLRMWYFSFNVTPLEEKTKDTGGYCYAESRDGINWEKPDLGIVEWRGSKKNNFFTSLGAGNYLHAARKGMGLTAKDREGNILGVLNNMDGLSVVRDDEADENERYKLIANMQDHRMWARSFPVHYPEVTDQQLKNAKDVFGQYMMTSPDGINWDEAPVFIKGRCNGDYMMVMRDERNKSWWLNERPISINSTRLAGLSKSRDLINWSEPTEAVFFPDEEAGFGRMWEWHGGMTPFNYGNQNLGFLEKWRNAGIGQTCELISQREGGAWQRVKPGEDILEVGSEDSICRQRIYPLHNEPIRIGDKLYIYFNGRYFKNNFTDRKDREDGSGISAAVIGLDRFAGLVNFRLDPGLLLTKVTEPEGDMLLINSEYMGGKGVRVAIRDPYNQDIPGFELDSCVPVTSNEARYTVRWKTQNDLTKLRGKNIRLYFEVSGASIYSYKWSE